jgi:hypothetical protein
MIMMIDSSPWHGIDVPRKDFNVRQVALETFVPCYWGRDSDGAYLFIVELVGNHTEQYRKNVVSVKGLDVDLRLEDQGHQKLVLALARNVDHDLFKGLCNTLASSLVKATDSVNALSISLMHIRRWKTFLAGKSQLLPCSDIQGLFAELVFLQELINRKMSSLAAVEAWLGSERTQQDFIYNNTAIEIKSLAGTERSCIKISSEDQLESLKDRLFLRVYYLNTSNADAIGAMSLNDIVTSVYGKLDDVSAVESFERKLIARGYAPLPEYDEPRFVVSNVRSYKVVNDFPRLIRSRVPIGIAKITYEIRLEAIAPFECEDTAIFGEKQ